MRWIGLDVHHRYVHVAEIEQDGGIAHSRLQMNQQGLAALQERLGEDAEVVLEASTSSAKLYDVLKTHARTVVVAHPAQTRGASALHVKTDLRDAEALALLLKSGFVRPVWVPPPDCRALRSLLEYRSMLSTLRTATINRVYACFRGELLDYPPGLSIDNIQKAGAVAWDEPLMAIPMSGDLP